MLAIGFAGTAKNTGKTTTALHILDLAQRAGFRCGLTSIGYDGENRDNITGLPKPRYFVQPGMLLATAESCLVGGSAGYQIAGETHIQTILGRVMVAEITQPGLVVLAGPNRRTDLERVSGIFARLGADLVLVDGALNRIVPLVGADGLVLSTGAALDERIPAIVAHVHALIELFALPVCARESANPAGLLRLDGGSLLSEAEARRVLSGLDGTCRDLVIPGACDPAILAWMLDRIPAQLRGLRLVFSSPLHLVASGAPQAWERAFAGAYEKGFRVACLEKPSVRLVTVNPFFPHYDTRKGGYRPDSVDKLALLEAVRAQVQNVPVVDIRQPHADDLLGILGFPPRNGEFV